MHAGGVLCQTFVPALGTLFAIHRLFRSRFLGIQPVEEAGDGTEFGLEIDPNPIEFGTLAVDCADTQPVVLRNIGEGDLEILDFEQSDGHFWIEEGPVLPFWLPAGTEQVVQIGFSPPGTGSFQGRLVVDAAQGRAQGAKSDRWRHQFVHRHLGILEAQAPTSCLHWIAVVP